MLPTSNIEWTKLKQITKSQKYVYVLLHGSDYVYTDHENVQHIVTWRSDAAWQAMEFLDKMVEWSESLLWHDADPEDNEKHVVEYKGETMDVVFIAPDPGDMYRDGFYSGGWAIFDSGETHWLKDAYEEAIDTLKEAKESALAILKDNAS